MAKDLQKGDNLPKKEKKEDDFIIPESIKSLLEKANIPQNEKRLIAIQIASYFKGPLPPPDILRQYNDIVKDGAERIFNRYEAQSSHRMQLEDHAVKEELKQSSRGQLFGFVISIFGLGLAGLLAYLGHEAIAGIIGGSTIVSLATVFVVGKYFQKQDMENK